MAARQYGVVSFAQLAAGGLDRHDASRAVAAGHLIGIHQGVFAVGHPVADRRGMMLAACLACGPRAATSHRFAGELFGFVGAGGRKVDVTVPTRAGLRRATVTIHRAQLEGWERGVCDRVPCTTPARTLVDIAATIPEVLPRCIKEAGGLGMLDVAAIDAVLRRYPGRRGSRRIRELIDGAALPELTRSKLERYMYRLCRAARLPLPRMNLSVAAGDRTYELDCAWPAERLNIECDSRWHDNPVSATSDAERDQALTLAGWRVHRLRWAQIVGSPERAAATIRHLLTQQRRLLGEGGR